MFISIRNDFYDTISKCLYKILQNQIKRFENFKLAPEQENHKKIVPSAETIGKHKQKDWIKTVIFRKL